jgi:peptidoglycan/LPS O-acetylase OafA/YrhL
MFNNSHDLSKVHAQRYNELDALRGLAALSIVLFHFTINDNGILLGWSFSYGVTAVDIFFMISGFVIFQSIENTKKWQDFVVKRFARLYPAFWYCMLITAFVAVLVEPQNINPLQILANATMAPAYFGMENLDGSYWTLLVELTFYLWIFGVFISHQVRDVTRIGTITLLVIVAFHSMRTYYPGFYEFAVKKMQLLNHFPLFLSGIIFYHLKNADRPYKNSVLLIFSLLTSFYLHDKGGTSQYHVSFFEHCVAITFFHLVFALFISGRMKFIIVKPLLMLGQVSYCLYLIHQYVGLQIISKLTIVYGFNIYFAVIFTITTCIILAYLVTRFIEIPCYQLVRNWYEQSGKRIFSRQDKDLVIH